jgi:probable F420-dependent oxidoreductase
MSTAAATGRPTPYRLAVTMPGLGIKIETFAGWARLAEEAGFDAVYDYEIWHNPFTVHMTCAAATSRITLGTGIATAFTRSPYEFANAAADVDEYSCGRLTLGVGIGASYFLEAFHSTDASHRVSRLREFVQVVRLAWEQLETQDPALRFEGEHYRFVPPPVNPWGGRELARRRIPILCAGMGPQMMQLAGEVGDGWIGYMATPRLLAERIRPNVTIGAERAGRDPSKLSFASETICCVHEDRQVAMRRARIHVGIYACDPTSDAVIELHGLQEDRDAVRAAIAERGPLAAAETTSDELVRTLSLAGTPGEIHEQLRAFDGLLDEVILHPPYMPPFTPAETEDSYLNIIRALRRD